MVSQTFEEKNKLLFVDNKTLIKELHIGDPTNIEIKSGENSELEGQADSIAKRVLDLDLNNDDLAEGNKIAFETMGLDLQKKSASKSAMLREPIRNLASKSEDGGDVANALVDLKIKVEDLDPANVDFNPGWFSRTLGFLPFIGKPLKKYFTKYESAQTVLAAITNSLKKGQKELERDNITLKDDQSEMRKLTHKLEKAIKLAQMIDLRLEARLNKDIEATDPKYKFIQEEILFPLRQRIQDLQQQLAVNQQGVLTIEVIVRNNKELIRGVNRALNVTMSALEVAVTLALALNRQKIVLDKIQGLNATTNSLISGTAERLKTQGVEIHKMAASTNLDMEVLKKSFEDIRAAMDDISKFRQEALPNMARTIIELNTMTSEQDKVIQKMEEGNDINDALKIDPV